LKSDVQALNKENRGFVGWVKKWGAFVGLLAGLVAIPKALFDFYTVIVTQPGVP
jgi:hypothetical protein